MRVLFLVAVAVVGWLLYRLYFKALLAQGRPGRLKIGLVALGLVFLALAVTGRAPALFAVLGALMTQAMRFAPLLLRAAPWLAKWLGPTVAGTAGASGRVSQVRTTTLLMTLDHDSGAMSGRVLAGRFEGRTLDELDDDELQALHADCRRDDHEALRLLEAWLVRERSGSWSSNGASGAGADAGSHASTSGSMSVQEACEVLGVASDAPREEIVAAHRGLMVRLHPDKGGSHYLAAKVNEAKRVLLAAGAQD